MLAPRHPDVPGLPARQSVACLVVSLHDEADVVPRRPIVDVHRGLGSHATVPATLPARAGRPGLPDQHGSGTAGPRIGHNIESQAPISI